MKNTVIGSAVFTALAGISGVASAQGQEMGRVISTTPIVQQVSVPRQVCSNQQVVTEERKSGAGLAIGAIAGGLLGNTIGHGSGRAAATAIGVMGGAITGNNLERGGGSQVQNVQNCSTQNFYENRTTAYNVTYEYAGKQYQVQMPNDPGQWVPLQVTPYGGAQQAPAYQQAPVYQQPPQYIQPPVQYIQRAPVVYQEAPYYVRPYNPVSFSIGLGYYGGHGGWGGHGWR